MVLLVKECFRLRILPLICVFILVTLWSLGFNLHVKEIQTAHIITSLRWPLINIFPSSNEEKQTTITSSIKKYIWTRNGSGEYQKQNSENDEEQFLRDREMVYIMRRQRVEDVCKQLGRNVTFPSVDKANLNRLRWLNPRKLIMCFNAKVGTSSWSTYFLKIVRPNFVLQRENLHLTVKKILIPPHDRYSAKSLDLMEKFTKIMIVRHPFARIVSAYLDKIATRSFSKYADHIVRFYRPSSSSLNSTFPTFEEFVKYLIHTVPSNDDITGKNKGVNIHWAPYYSNCAPCNIHYDVILNMETIDEDTRYANHQFHLGIKENLKMNHHAPVSSESSSLKYFKTLPRDLILALYQRYRIDFLMYGYSISPFLKES